MFGAGLLALAVAGVAAPAHAYFSGGASNNGFGYAKAQTLTIVSVTSERVTGRTNEARFTITSSVPFLDHRVVRIDNNDGTQEVISCTQSGDRLSCVETGLGNHSYRVTVIRHLWESPGVVCVYKGGGKEPEAPCGPPAPAPFAPAGTSSTSVSTQSQQSEADPAPEQAESDAPEEAKPADKPRVDEPEATPEEEPKQEESWASSVPAQP